MIYYTYAYLREDKTPYYIGKGQSNRAYRRSKRDIKPPKDKSRILILKNNLTEEEAFKHERYMIAVFGRKDLGTGILYNRTDGGDGASGRIPNEETRRKISEAHKGKTHSKETRRKLSQAHKGKTLSEEHKRKMSKSLMGNDHSKGNKIDREIVNKLRNQRKKNKWWNNGYDQKFCPNCPYGWNSGRLPIQGNYSKPGNKNPNSSHYEIKFDDGRCEVIFCLSEWAINNGYKIPSLYQIVGNKRKSQYKDILRIIKLPSRTPDELAH
jgi:hypothetical protein